MLNVQTKARELLSTMSVPVRALVLTVAITSSVCLAVPSVASFLVMTPTYVLSRFYIHTIVTGCFVEANAVAVLVHTAVVVFYAPFIEPLWSQREFLRFLSVTALVSMVLTLFLSIFIYALSATESLLFRPQGGLSAVIAGIFVAMKQLAPERQLSILGLVPLRAKNLGSSVAVLVIILCIVQLIPLMQCMLYCIGLFVSWCYLRFYQKNEAGLRGDPAPSFAFATFFVEALQAPVAMACDVVYKGACRIRLVPELRAAQSLPTHQPSSSSVNKARALPPATAAKTTDRIGNTSFADVGLSDVAEDGRPLSDAERRRLLALRALDRRLGNLPSSTVTSPSSSSSAASSQPTSISNPSPPAPSSSSDA